MKQDVLGSRVQLRLPERLEELLEEDLSFRVRPTKRMRSLRVVFAVGGALESADLLPRLLNRGRGVARWVELFGLIESLHDPTPTTLVSVRTTLVLAPREVPTRAQELIRPRTMFISRRTKLTSPRPLKLHARIVLVGTRPRHSSTRTTLARARPNDVATQLKHARTCTNGFCPRMIDVTPRRSFIGRAIANVSGRPTFIARRTTL